MNAKVIKDRLRALGTASKKKKIIIIIIAAVLIVLIAFLIHKRKQSKLNNNDMNMVTTAMVARGDISNELTSSGTLSPKDTYTITSLVTGEILEANFEEGDPSEIMYCV